MIVNYDRFPLIYHMKEAITCIPGKPSPSSLWLSPGAILNLSYSQWCYVFVNECVVHYVKSIFLKERSFQYNSGHLFFCFTGGILTQWAVYLWGVWEGNWLSDSIRGWSIRNMLPRRCWKGWYQGRKSILCEKGKAKVYGNISSMNWNSVNVRIIIGWLEKKIMILDINLSNHFLLPK